MSLKQFVVDIATNVDLKRRYAEDPEGTMAAAGLTVEERAAFASGDSATMRTALGKPDNDCMSQTGQLIPRGSVIKKPGGRTVNVTENSFLISQTLRDKLTAKAKGKAGAKAAAGGSKKGSRKKTAGGAGKKR